MNKIEDKERVDYLQHTDIRIVATLLCGKIAFLTDDGKFVPIDAEKITLKRVTRKKSTGQCRFLLENRSSVKLPTLIMAYYNDRLYVSSKSFSSKLNDLKDIISSGSIDNS